jgi:hypothetical protein
MNKPTTAVRLTPRNIVFYGLLLYGLMGLLEALPKLLGIAAALFWG